MPEFVIREIPLDQIDVGRINVRKSNIEEGIDELRKNIEEIGLQQPIVVYQKPDMRYELIIGQRRYLAFKRAGMDKISAILTSIKNDTDAILRSFSENLHRLDLEYGDKMQAAIVLLDEFKGSIKDVAHRLGVSQQTVKNYLGYSAVPDKIKQMVDDGKLGATTALRISKYIMDDDLAIKVAKKIQSLPRGSDRSLLIDIARENPDKQIKELNGMAKKLRRKITIYLTEKLYMALAQASKEVKSEEEDVVKEAVEEWLKKRGYIE